MVYYKYSKGRENKRKQNPQSKQYHKPTKKSSQFFNLTNSKGSYKMTSIKVTFMQIIRFRLLEFFRKSHKRVEARACTMETMETI